MEVFTASFLREQNSDWKGRVALLNRRDAYATLLALAALFWPFLGLAQMPGDVPVSSAVAAAPANTGGPQLTVVNHLGDDNLSLRDGKLLTHHRSTDPFSVPIRGKFRGLPPTTVEKPVTSGAPATIAPPPTLAMAVQQLPVGAVNPNGREMLVASHLVREGDLLVIELSGHRFFVWVQSIDQRGVQFCDLDLKQRALRALRTGPKELASDAVEQQPDIQSFLK